MRCAVSTKTTVGATGDHRRIGDLNKRRDVFLFKFCAVFIKNSTLSQCPSERSSLSSWPGVGCGSTDLRSPDAKETARITQSDKFTVDCGRSVRYPAPFLEGISALAE
eukprot:COSAG02_NODE_1420_length_12692_cov_3.543397_5_plen_108_part_00